MLLFLCLQIGNDFYPHQENASKVPPAPTGRAYTSPLVDMFNNPTTAPKAPSEKLNHSAGERPFPANWESVNDILQCSELPQGFSATTTM